MSKTAPRTIRKPSPLLREIEAFCALHGMPATKFGVEAVNDGHLVRTMRLGRRLWPEIEKKIRRFMRARKPAGKSEGQGASA